jgi:uncharacterized membrane protein
MPDTHGTDTKDEKLPTNGTRGTLKRDILWGSAIGLLATAICVFISAKAFPSSYYLVWLLASSMGVCVLLAWFLYLRADMFLSREKSHRKESYRARRVLLSAAGFLLLASVVSRLLWGIGARY